MGEDIPTSTAYEGVFAPLLQDVQNLVTLHPYSIGVHARVKNHSPQVRLAVRSVSRRDRLVGGVLPGRAPKDLDAKSPI